MSGYIYRLYTSSNGCCEVPAEFGVDGYYFRYERHFVYWKRLASGDVGIVTKHRIDRFRDDYPG